MIRISTAQLWVHDQDEALAFWTEKVGFEVCEDVNIPELGNFRWLTVAPRDQEDFAIVLTAIPEPPSMDEATRTLRSPSSCRSAAVPGRYRWCSPTSCPRGSVPPRHSPDTDRHHRLE